jgi:hypothetical protein
LLAAFAAHAVYRLHRSPSDERCPLQLARAGSFSWPTWEGMIPSRAASRRSGLSTRAPSRAGPRFRSCPARRLTLPTAAARPWPPTSPWRLLQSFRSRPLAWT